MLSLLRWQNVKKFYGVAIGSLSTEIRGLDRDKKWSDLLFVFIPRNSTKTMAEMTDDERKTRTMDMLVLL